ncbi:MAG: ferrous iron transport protein A [Methanoregulaceae archaeon]
MYSPEKIAGEKPPLAGAVTLDCMPLAGMCRVGSVTAQGTLRKRLMEMGFVPGALVEIVRIAPLGDPVDYRIKGYHISLRATEAKLISVVPEGA